MAAPSIPYTPIPEHWQPIRILRALDSNSRSLGWPPENRDSSQMEAWCAKHCRAGWQIDFDDESVATFYFEARRDASEFAIRWFPFKCV